MSEEKFIHVRRTLIMENKQDSTGNYCYKIIINNRKPPLDVKKEKIPSESDLRTS